LLVVTVVACRDLSDFSTGAGSYQGPVVQADFVRSGVARNVNLCLTLDTNHLQDAPGAVSTSDGSFEATALRPIPQIWQDPLSTLSFGEGRTKNLLYIATPQPDSGSTADVLVVVSLMDSSNVEVRMLRGAPSVAAEGGMAGSPANLFAVFTLDRQPSPCPF